MRKLPVLMLAALALLALGSYHTYAAQDSMTVQMKAQNGSGQDGTATLTAKGDADVMVVLNLNNGTSVAQPAHIHKGTCANLDPNPAFPLTSVTNGKSDTEVMVSMKELEKGGYAINVHKSAADAKTYVSCGDIAAMMATGSNTGTSGSSTGGNTAGNSSMPGTGSGDQTAAMIGIGMLALIFLGAGLTLGRRKA